MKPPPNWKEATAICQTMRRTTGGVRRRNILGQLVRMSGRWVLSPSRRK